MEIRSFFFAFQKRGLLHKIKDKGMIYLNKLGFANNITLLLVILTLSACSIRQGENSTKIEEPSDSIVDSQNESTKTDLYAISIEKIETYEGLEITDWMDEQTVVLAKENKELEKMSLLENAEFYPRSLYLYNLRTKEYKTIKAPKNMFLGGATLSPDKKHLLYYEYSIGDVAYYLMNLESGEQSSVTEENIGTAYTAEWTDEQVVIGASYAGGAYLADIDDNLTQIAELQDEQLFTIDKIQGKVYFIDTDSQVYMLDLITKEKKHLPFEQADGIILSPDGKKILVTKTTGSTKRLLIADAVGNMQSTITEGTEVTGASWSPNQQMIAYQLVSVIDGKDRSGLYLYDLATGESREIALNVGYSNITWSPSGKKISVTEQDGKKYNSSIIYLK